MTAGYGNGAGDPSGTGSGLYCSQRLGRIGSGVPANLNRDNWVDKSSFLCPGRGVGPTGIPCRGSSNNLLNHVNLADPNLTIISSSFGKITRARTADFGGNRTGEVSARIEF